MVLGLILFLAFEQEVYLAELLEDKMYHSALSKNDVDFVKINGVFLVYVGIFPSAKYLGLAFA